MRTLTYDMDLTDLEEERAYTIARLEAHPLTGSLEMTTDYESLQEPWVALVMREVALIREVAAAGAAIDIVDDLLDTLLNTIVNSILIVVDNNRNHPLYQRFFPSQRPSDVKKPVLGEQLETMRSWIPTLMESPHAGLKAHAAELQRLVTAADEAVAAERKASQELTDFNEIGERKAFVDRFNALRKRTFGHLGELLHKHPEANLPNDLPEQFFRRDTRRPPSMASVKRVIQRLEARLERQRVLLGQLEAAEAERVKKKQDETRAEVAELEAQAAKALARAAELKSKIDNKT
jgi:hypothetical protein